MAIEETEYKAIMKRITFLTELLKQPGATIFSRVVKGVQADPAIVLPANIDTYTFINGMDLTADLDSKEVMVDLNMMASMTVIPTTVKFQIEVDGQIDERANVTWAPSTASRYTYTGVIVIKAGPGEHRYRAFMSSATAVTVTFTGQFRYMRVTGLVDKRRRFLHGK